ncbi:MAG: sulfur carrier protein ThiS adenylyltransferase ThiF [Eubacteriales bacterium]
MIPNEEEVYEALCLGHGKKQQEKFSRGNVVILGLGSLGSHIAVALARAGVGYLGHIHLVDFDGVELENIHCQHYDLANIGLEKTEVLKEQLKQINPYLEVKATFVKVSENNLGSLIKGMDVVIEAVDSPVQKSMIVDGFFTQKTPEQVLFAASGYAGLGDGNLIQTRMINQSFYLTGDGKSDFVKEKTLYASRVSLCAAAQAHAVLRYLIEKAP